MEHILRTLAFAVDAERVTPDAPQFGGVAGDDGTTRVTMTLASGLCPPDARYRILCTDGLGDTHTSDFIPLGQGGVLSFTLPAAWTAAGGLCACQAVIEGFDGQGQVQSALYTLPCEIYLMGREGEAPVRRAVGSLLADCHAAVHGCAAAADAAAQSEQVASEQADKAQTFADDAVTAAVAANEDALAAAQSAAQAAETAAEMGDVAALLPLLGGALAGHRQGAVLSFGDLSPLPHAVRLTAETASLIPFPYLGQSETVNGITFTVGEDGSIDISGTASADAELVLFDEGADVRTERDFCLYGVPQGTPAQLRLTYLADSGAAVTVTDDGQGVTHPRARRITGLVLRVPQGAAVESTVQPMLVHGAVRLPFGKAQQPTAPALKVLGKNQMDYLALYGRYADAYQFTIKDGVVSGVSSRCIVPKQMLPKEWIGQPVTFSARLRCNGPADKARAVVGVYNADGSTVIGEGADGGGEDMVRCCLTRTARRGDMFMISHVGSASGSQTVWIADMQLEWGDKATDYVPYKEPQELAWPADGVLPAASLVPGDTLWAAQGGVQLGARYQRDVAAAIGQAKV